MFQFVQSSLGNRTNGVRVQIFDKINLMNWTPIMLRSVRIHEEQVRVQNPDSFTHCRQAGAEVAHQTHLALKNALDPNGILNPDKFLDQPPVN